MSAVSNQCFCLDDADPQLFVAELTSRGRQPLEQRRSFGRTFSLAVEAEQPVRGGAEPIGDPDQGFEIGFPAIAGVVGALLTGT